MIVLMCPECLSVQYLIFSEGNKIFCFGCHTEFEDINKVKAVEVDLKTK